MDILTGYNFDKFSYFRIKHLFNLESHCPLILLQALHSLYCLYVYTFPNNGNMLWQIKLQNLIFLVSTISILFFVMKDEKLEQ